MNRYMNWALSLLCWDGLLPGFVCSVPMLVVFLFPRQEIVHTLFNLFAPIAAFCCRVLIGRLRFARGEQYSLQQILFYLGIFFLVILDTLLILFQTVEAPIPKSDWMMLGLFYLIYLSVMAVSLFPLRALVADLKANSQRGEIFE